jgi:hypothetical protein
MIFGSSLQSKNVRKTSLIHKALIIRNYSVFILPEEPEELEELEDELVEEPHELVSDPLVIKIGSLNYCVLLIYLFWRS